MREITIHIKCDFCGDSVPEDEVLQLTGQYAAHSGGKTLALDLCTSCANHCTHVALPDTKSKPGIWQCPTCFKTFKSVRGLNQHRTKQGHH